jgi:excisionase family DNA binding protein
MVSTSTVRRWILNGQLLAVKLPSGQYRVRVADFKEFLTKNHISITDELNQLLRSSKN